MTRTAAALLLSLFMGCVTLVLAAPKPAKSPPAPPPVPVRVAFPDTMQVSLIQPDTIAVSLPKNRLPDPAWGLVGVALGFLLGEGSRSFQSWRRRRRLKAALRDECLSLLSQVPDFIDICRQMINSLRDHRILPGAAVAAMRTVYAAAITELTPHLNSRERTLLHVVHERLKVGDDMIENHLRDLLEALRHGQIGDPWEAWVARLEEQIGSYRLVAQLLQSYVDGKPLDVFNLPQPPGDAGGASAPATASTPILPPTHDVARHFIRIVGDAREALHGIELKIGNTAFESIGPRTLRDDLKQLMSTVEEFGASKARVSELRAPELETRLASAFARALRQYKRADRAVAPYELPHSPLGVGSGMQQFRLLAESVQSEVAFMDAVTKELEQLTT